ncbi:unnamed protein product [Amoebophrya sp. A25]|nr:unnamed protein product [Amoebophrya sp. A25]|eukprot:GSA25T00019906001.1
MAPPMAGEVPRDYVFSRQSQAQRQLHAARVYEALNGHDHGRVDPNRYTCDYMATLASSYISRNDLRGMEMVKELLAEKFSSEEIPLNFRSVVSRPHRALDLAEAHVLRGVLASKIITAQAQPKGVVVVQGTAGMDSQYRQTKEDHAAGALSKSPVINPETEKFAKYAIAITDFLFEMIRIIKRSENRLEMDEIKLLSGMYDIDRVWYDKIVHVSCTAREILATEYAARNQIVVERRLKRVLRSFLDTMCSQFTGMYLEVKNELREKEIDRLLRVRHNWMRLRAKVQSIVKLGKLGRPAGAALTGADAAAASPGVAGEQQQAATAAAGDAAAAASTVAQPVMPTADGAGVTSGSAEAAAAGTTEAATADGVAHQATDATAEAAAVAPENVGTDTKAEAESESADATAAPGGETAGEREQPAPGVPVVSDDPAPVGDAPAGADVTDPEHAEETSAPQAEGDHAQVAAEDPAAVAAVEKPAEEEPPAIVTAEAATHQDAAKALADGEHQEAAPVATPEAGATEATAGQEKKESTPQEEVEAPPDAVPDQAEAANTEGGHEADGPTSAEEPVTDAVEPEPPAKEDVIEARGDAVEPEPPAKQDDQGADAGGAPAAASPAKSQVVLGSANEINEIRKDRPLRDFSLADTAMVVVETDKGLEQLGGPDGDEENEAENALDDARLDEIEFDLSDMDLIARDGLGDLYRKVAGITDFVEEDTVAVQSASSSSPASSSSSSSFEEPLITLQKVAAAGSGEAQVEDEHEALMGDQEIVVYDDGVDRTWEILGKYLERAGLGDPRDALEGLERALEDAEDKANDGLGEVENLVEQVNSIAGTWFDAPWEDTEERKKLQRTGRYTAEEITEILIKQQAMQKKLDRKMHRGKPPANQYRGAPHLAGVHATTTARLEAVIAQHRKKAEDNIAHHVNECREHVWAVARSLATLVADLSRLRGLEGMMQARLMLGFSDYSLATGAKNNKRAKGGKAALLAGSEVELVTEEARRSDLEQKLQLWSTQGFTNMDEARVVFGDHAEVTSPERVAATFRAGMRAATPPGGTQLTNSAAAVEEAMGRAVRQLNELQDVPIGANDIGRIVTRKPKDVVEANKDEQGAGAVAGVGLSSFAVAGALVPASGGGPGGGNTGGEVVVAEQANREHMRFERKTSAESLDRVKQRKLSHVSRVIVNVRLEAPERKNFRTALDEQSAKERLERMRPAPPVVKKARVAAADAQVGDHQDASSPSNQVEVPASLTGAARGAGMKQSPKKALNMRTHSSSAAGLLSQSPSPDGKHHSDKAQGPASVVQAKALAQGIRSRREVNKMNSMKEKSRMAKMALRQSKQQGADGPAGPRSATTLLNEEPEEPSVSEHFLRVLQKCRDTAIDPKPGSMPGAQARIQGSPKVKRSQSRRNNNEQVSSAPETSESHPSTASAGAEDTTSKSPNQRGGRNRGQSPSRGKSGKNTAGSRSSSPITMGNKRKNNKNKGGKNNNYSTRTDPAQSGLGLSAAQQMTLWDRGVAQGKTFVYYNDAKVLDGVDNSSSTMLMGGNMNPDGSRSALGSTFGSTMFPGSSSDQMGWSSSSFAGSTTLAGAKNEMPMPMETSMTSFMGGAQESRSMQSTFLSSSSSSTQLGAAGGTFGVPGGFFNTQQSFQSASFGGNNNNNNINYTTRMSSSKTSFTFVDGSNSTILPFFRDLTDNDDTVLPRLLRDRLLDFLVRKPRVSVKYAWMLSRLRRGREDKGLMPTSPGQSSSKFQHAGGGSMTSSSTSSIKNVGAVGGQHSSNKTVQGRQQKSVEFTFGRDTGSPQELFNGGGESRPSSPKMLNKNTSSTTSSDSFVFCKTTKNHTFFRTPKSTGRNFPVFKDSMLHVPQELREPAEREHRAAVLDQRRRERVYDRQDGVAFGLEKDFIPQVRQTKSVLGLLTTMRVDNLVGSIGDRWRMRSPTAQKRSSGSPSAAGSVKDAAASGNQTQSSLAEAFGAGPSSKVEFSKPRNTYKTVDTFPSVTKYLARSLTERERKLQRKRRNALFMKDTLKREAKRRRELGGVLAGLHRQVSRMIFEERCIEQENPGHSYDSRLYFSHKLAYPMLRRKSVRRFERELKIRMYLKKPSELIDTQKKLGGGLGRAKEENHAFLLNQMLKDLARLPEYKEMRQRVPRKELPTDPEELAHYEQLFVDEPIVLAPPVTHNDRIVFVRDQSAAPAVMNPNAIAGKKMGQAVSAEEIERQMIPRDKRTGKKLRYIWKEHREEAEVIDPAGFFQSVEELGETKAQQDFKHGWDRSHKHRHILREEMVPGFYRVQKEQERRERERLERVAQDELKHAKRRVKKLEKDRHRAEREARAREEAEAAALVDEDELLLRGTANMTLRGALLHESESSSSASASASANENEDSAPGETSSRPTSSKKLKKKGSVASSNLTEEDAEEQRKYEALVEKYGQETADKLLKAQQLEIVEFLPPYNPREETDMFYSPLAKHARQMEEANMMDSRYWKYRMGMTALFRKKAKIAGGLAASLRENDFDDEEDTTPPESGTSWNKGDQLGGTTQPTSPDNSGVTAAKGGKGAPVAAASPTTGKRGEEQPASPASQPRSPGGLQRKKVPRWTREGFFRFLTKELRIASWKIPKDNSHRMVKLMDSVLEENYAKTLWHGVSTYGAQNLIAPGEQEAEFKKLMQKYGIAQGKKLKAVLLHRADSLASPTSPGGAPEGAAPLDQDTDEEGDVVKGFGNTLLANVKAASAAKTD